MKYFVYLPVLLLAIWSVQAEHVSTVEAILSQLPTDLKDEPPTILIALMVRNKAHILPYVLSYLEQQIYPKHRLALW